MRRNVYTKQQFADDLLEQLELNPAMLQISRWAYRLYLDKIQEFEFELESIVMKLVAMEEGPEFEYTISELYELVNELSS